MQERSLLSLFEQLALGRGKKEYGTCIPLHDMATKQDWAHLSYRDCSYGCTVEAQHLGMDCRDGLLAHHEASMHAIPVHTTNNDAEPTSSTLCHYPLARTIDDDCQGPDCDLMT